MTENAHKKIIKSVDYAVEWLLLKQFHNFIFKKFSRACQLYQNNLNRHRWWMAIHNLFLMLMYYVNI